MNGTERHGEPRPIGWRAANRIVKGQGGGPGTEDLHTLIEVASASSSAAVESGDHEAVLAAFRESGAAWESGTARQSAGGRRGAQRAVGGAVGSRHTSLAVTLRFSTALLIVCGVGVAAASAGVLPSGVQRIAHDYFGLGGVPTPSGHAPSSSAATSGTPGSTGGDGNSAATRSKATNGATASSAVLVPLCQQVFQDPGRWQQDLGTAEQATLITAAGDAHKVKSYCAQLLGSVGNVATPSAAAPGIPSAPSATPSGPRGKAHVSHSPAANGNGS